MQRWHLTLLLAVQAAFAAVFLPDWTRIAPDPVPIPHAGGPGVAEASVGSLRVQAGLDQSVVPAGEISERYLVLTLDGNAVEQGSARPFNVGVVLDSSGSMASAGKLDYARLATDTLLRDLDERDRFALVSFANRAEVLVPSELVVDAERIRRRLGSLHATGGTNLGEGLLVGLGQIAPFAGPESLDRIIVISDGRVNQGETSIETLASWAGAAGADGIAVSTIGLGLDYNEDLLARMADWGGGSYHFVDDPGALASIFQAELDRMSSVAVQGVAVEIRLAAGVQILDVLGYDYTTTADSVRIPVGEIIDGESRKVVLKLRLPAAAADTERAVARILVTRTDGDAPPELAVNAYASPDSHRVAGSVDRLLAVLGTQAEASALADMGLREWEKGNVDGMRDLFDSSVLVAGEAASRYGSDSLKKQALSIEANLQSLEAAAPSSQDGRYQAILQKESNRALAH